MAKNIPLTNKKVQINKSQATVVLIIAFAVFITIFSILSSRSLWSQRSYQARVITKKEEARDNLIANKAAVDSLETSFKNFVNQPSNIIDGNPNGTGERDGDNAKIILDALPSKYDFPAVTSSLEKVILDKKFKFNGITGVDDEVNQNKSAANADPQVVEMPFQIDVEGSNASVQELLVIFEKSIRPFHATKINLKGSDNKLQLVLDSKTFYRPEKTFTINKKEVK